MRSLSEYVKPLVPLAFQICRFKILEARRDRGRATQLDDALPVPDPGPGIEGQLEKDQMGRRLKLAITELSERCQMLFRLRLEGRPTAEMAKLMAASEPTILVWEHRCRKNLFAKLA